MRILLLYDNFVRDYRGLLLLSAFLERKGHKVWIKAGWDDVRHFALLYQADVLVTGQIAEWATHKFAVIAKELGMRLVINTSEPILAENNFGITLTYNTSELNQDIID